MGSDTYTVAIIQARMGSTRLPEKVLKEIRGRPMLEYVVERTRRASLVDDVVVATSDAGQDDAIAEFCADHGVECFRGSEPDVLDRYYQAAREYDADTVVRITGDCPLITPAVIDRVVGTYGQSDSDYVSNILYYTYPVGFDVEVFPFETLEETWETATTDRQREHVTPYMRESGEVTRRNVTNPVDLSRYSYTDESTVLRWTVDYPEDLEFVREVYDRLCANGDWLVSQTAVLELLEREPELRDINDDREHEW